MGPPSATAEAESWFLARGLPAVLTTRGRWRRLWSRSAPVLAFYATIQACGIPIVLIQGREHAAGMAEEHALSPAEWVLLAVAIGALLLAVVIGWLVSRLPQGRVRAAAATVVAAVAVVARLGRDPAFRRDLEGATNELRAALKLPPGQPDLP